MAWIDPPDRVAETTTTTGTGAYTLDGSLTGFQAVSDVLSDGDRSFFVVEEHIGGGWEIFIGTYTASGDTVSRDRILKSSNSNNAVSWSAGTKNIFCALPAEYKGSSPMLAAVDSATIIAVGDMVWLDTDDVKPASDFAWDTDLATTQASFAGSFLGIAMEASANGETDPILVETSPLVRFVAFASVSANYEVGGILGPDENPANTLSNTTLESTTSGAGIARSLVRGTTLTQLDVGFASAFHPGSANTNASIG